MSFDRGSVVMLPFPFSDLSKAKNRPVLALSTPDAYGDFIALAMTSRAHHAHSLAVSPEDCLVAALPKPTWIRTDKVFSFNEALVVKVVGKLSDKLIQQALDKLCKVVGKA